MRLFPLALSLALVGTAAFTIEACGGDSSSSAEIPGAPDAVEAGSAADGSQPPGTGDKDSGAGPADASVKDSSLPEDAGCAPVVLSLDAGGGCGTMEFGAVAAAFTGVDAGDGGDYVGGVFAAGVYDAVLAERLSGSGGSWRETFVSDGSGRFTRIRQVDLGTGNGPGPISRRSGTYSVSGKNITFTYDCAQSNGTPITTPGNDTLPYELVHDQCAATYRYGATGVRISLKRR